MALPIESKARKNMPIARGVLAYFPDALAAVAEVSRVGNEKHNPGEPMHWSKGKSDDHADCVARHLIEAGTIDEEDGLLHSAKLAWRALALLQTELEKIASVDKMLKSAVKMAGPIDIPKIVKSEHRTDLSPDGDPMEGYRNTYGIAAQGVDPRTGLAVKRCGKCGAQEGDVCNDPFDCAFRP